MHDFALEDALTDLAKETIGDVGASDALDRLAREVDERAQSRRWRERIAVARSQAR